MTPNYIQRINIISDIKQIYVRLPDNVDIVLGVDAFIDDKRVELHSIKGQFNTESKYCHIWNPQGFGEYTHLNVMCVTH